MRYTVTCKGARNEITKDVDCDGIDMDLDGLRAFVITEGPCPDRVIIFATSSENLVCAVLQNPPKPRQS